MFISVINGNDNDAALQLRNRANTYKYNDLNYCSHIWPGLLSSIFEHNIIDWTGGGSPTDEDSGF